MNEIGSGSVMGRLDDVRKGGSEVYRRLHDQVQKYIDIEKQTNQQIQIEFFKTHSASALGDKKTVSDLFDFSELDDLIRIEKEINA